MAAKRKNSALLANPFFFTVSATRFSKFCGTIKLTIAIYINYIYPIHLVKGFTTGALLQGLYYRSFTTGALLQKPKGGKNLIYFINYCNFASSVDNSLFLLAIYGSSRVNLTTPSLSIK